MLFPIVGALKTKQDIERLAKKHGATIEEDCGYRDMRVFQIVAPNGKRWSSDSITSIRVEWQRGTSSPVNAFNEATYHWLERSMSNGLESIPSDELAFYAND